MANIEETEQWDSGIYQLETTDPVQGGADGVDNAPHKNLANRTQWLKNNKADKNGNAANKFKVANATATDEAVNLAQLNTKANLAGSATQKFKVANATAADEAIPKQQAESLILSALTSAGTVVAFATAAAPGGFLECNGAALSRTVYADLFSAIGTTYGAGNGSTTFKIPDLRGEFIRGFDNGRGVDIGRTIGSFQADDFKSHVHAAHPSNASGYDTSNYFVSYSVNHAGFSVNTGTSGGSETRPRNIAMMYCIKY